MSKVHATQHGCKRHLNTIGTGDAYGDAHIVVHYVAAAASVHQAHKLSITAL